MLNTCRFCLKKYTNNCYYYVHLKTNHFIPETKHMFSQEEIELINKFYNARLNYDRKAYKKHNELCQNMDLICVFCNRKYKNMKSIRSHVKRCHTHEVHNEVRNEPGSNQNE
jgi:hypothetical protein